MSTDFDVDILIIGLGPAGSTLARMLDSCYKVAAIDRKRPGGDGFHKPCGGLLAPDAQKVLSRLDLTLPKKALVDPQIFAVRTYDAPANLLRYYQRFYMNLDRHQFDLWLQSLIPDRITRFQDAVCSRIEHFEGGYRVHFTNNGETKALTAQYLVGADGANSVVRRFLYPSKKIRYYMAIQQWFAEEHPIPFYSCVFDPRVTDCYSWSISKDGYFIFGGAYPPKDCRQRFENQLLSLKKAGFRFGTPLKTEACMVLRPSRPEDFCTGKENAFLIGEAGGFISPSSLEGISSAINTAILLSKVLNSKHPAPNKIYRRKTLPLRLRLFAKELKTPFMYNPLLRKLVMKSGLDSIDLIQK